MSLTDRQIHALEIAEKVSSVLSVLGTFFIIATFLSDSRFRKPINRLVFYAAWGNLFANVGTLISMSGIRMGSLSSLCQFQAFVIQWFLAADALWTFAMACNVYLSFFHHFDSSMLRGLEWKYLGACYSVPFVPALVFLLVKSEARGKIYGEAVLWCWISPRWNALRIAAFYGPVWVVILLTVFIYIRVGMVVLKWRKQLISMERSGSKPEDTNRDVPMRELSSPIAVSQPQYEVTVISQVPHSDRWKTGDNDVSPSASYQDDVKSPIHTRFSSIPEPPYPERQTKIVSNRPHVKRLDANKAALSYCKTALLFFFALLCTWVPSTINRVYTLVYPSRSLFGLDMASGLVLPLQGFWNTLIYIVTSFQACQEVWTELRTALFGQRATRPNRMPQALQITKHSSAHRALGSDDGRPDITMRMEGKNRVLQHNYQRSQDDDIGRRIYGSGPVAP